MWGPAGGSGPQGQPFSRFQLGGDPSPYYPLLAGGSMEITKPAHEMGATGGAYRYGATKVGGITNMVFSGGALRPLIVPGTAYPIGNFKGLLGGTGGGNYDAIAKGVQSEFITLDNLSSATDPSQLVVNGESFFILGTEFTAVREAFTTGAITVTATNGLGSITFSASVAALAFTAAYAYAPMSPNPVAGDIIAITDGATHYYRLTTNPTGVANIFPNYTGTGGAGLAFTIYRTGYGSYSHIVTLLSTSNRLFYYAGGLIPNITDSSVYAARPGGAGPAIQGVAPGAAVAHAMSPKLTPSGNNLYAVDIALYKSFLLYGFGTTIGWSVAGFPTAPVALFGATDFPDTNRTVVDISGTFICFERVGEQLIAFFTTSAWLIQATGGIPEFAFYQLPLNTGPLIRAIADPQIASATSYTRPTVSSGTEIFYRSRDGLTLLQNLSPTKISQSVDTYDFPDARGHTDQLKWDNASNSFLWHDAAGGRGLLHHAGLWSQLDLTAAYPNAVGFGGSYRAGVAIGLEPYRPLGLVFFDPASGNVYGVSDSIDYETTTTSTAPWTWATPIVSQGEIYPGFAFESLRPICRAASGANPALTIKVYAGSSPYNMQQWGSTITVNYQYGIPSSRYGATSGKCDAAYIGFVVSGSSWVELYGLALYSAETKQAR